MGFDQRKPRGLKPVEKIEVNTEHITLRYILFAICCIVAIFAIWYAVSHMLKTETGWQKVTANSTEEMSISGDLTFYYHIGKSGKAPRTEVRELSSLYTEQAARAWKLISAIETFDGVGNLATLNEHPNEDVTVEPELYKVLSEMQAVDRLWILYWAPCYDLLESTAAAATDEEAMLTDPQYSEEAKAIFTETSIMAGDKENINLQLLGDGKVRLCVPEPALSEYKETDTLYVDFGWLRNAVAVEIVADALVEQGYTYGVLSSQDGFIRNFDDSETAFTANLYGKAGQKSVIAASLQYAGAQSMVLYQAVPFLESDIYRMHAYQNGDVRTTYIGEHGCITPAMDSMLVYSADKSLVTLASRCITAFMTESIPEQELRTLPRTGIQAIWSKDATVFYTEEAADIGNLYENDALKFQISLVK